MERNLTGIDISLNDIENANVGPLFGGSTHHDVLRLQESPHHIQNTGFLYVGKIVVQSQRGITSH